jgi:hypothetical protein
MNASHKLSITEAASLLLATDRERGLADKEVTDRLAGAKESRGHEWFGGYNVESR